MALRDQVRDRLFGSKSLEQLAAEAPPFDVRVTDLSPPADVRQMLRNTEETTLCGGRFAVQWPKGSAPWAGKRLTMYCAEPLCIETRKCTGPRFVPHPDQFTKDPEERGALRRKITPEEAVLGARACAVKATGKDDARSDRAIARHIGLVWSRMMKELGRRDQWGLG